MERYIIPFDFKGKSHYVFIDKNASRQFYLIGKILPFTDESYPKEIPFHAISGLAGLAQVQITFESAIKITLFKFLETRGWLPVGN